MELKKRWKNKYTYVREMIQIVIGAILIIGFIYIGGKQTSSHTVAEQQSVVENAIRRAVVQCYAIEGIYPPNIDYLEEEYGIKINKEKYIVHYEIFASNIMPSITVIRKQWEE